MVALRFVTLSTGSGLGGNTQPKAVPGMEQAYLVCASCASYVQACVTLLENGTGSGAPRRAGAASASFAACDLCYATLGNRLTEAQISPARIVQLTGQGHVAHRSTGLRALRLCLSCGDYLVEGFERLQAGYGRPPQVRLRAAG